MNNRITSLRIDWFSNALASSADELHWRLEVYRNRNVQLYTTYNGVGDKMIEEKYGLHDFQRERIFSALESWEIQSPWDENYDLDVCDGYSYTIRLRYGDRSIKIIKGTVEFPPHWNELLVLLSAMCEMPLNGARDEIDWITHFSTDEACDRKPSPTDSSQMSVMIRTNTLTNIRPKPKQEIWQILTITAGGAVSFTSELWPETQNGYPMSGRNIQMMIPVADAEKIVESFSRMFFLSAIRINEYVMDVGGWEVTIVTADGRKHEYLGSMGMKPYCSLTQQVQNLIPISNLEVLG